MKNSFCDACTEVDPAGLIPQVRRAVLAVDPDQPAHSIVPLRDLVGDSVERDRFSMWLLGAFAGAAVLLAVMGIYGLMSYLVRQRTPEFGIRMALGAQRGDIFRMVVRHGGWMALVGLAAGLNQPTSLAVRWAEVGLDHLNHGFRRTS